MAIEIRGSTPLFEVYDMAASVAFHRDVIGFAIVATNKQVDTDPAVVDWALLRLNDVELMLNTADDPGERPLVRPVSRVFGTGVVLYLGCPDVDAAYQHLRAHGVETGPPKVAQYGMKQLYVRDPDGYSLCFQWQA